MDASDNRRSLLTLFNSDSMYVLSVATGGPPRHQNPAHQFQRSQTPLTWPMRRTSAPFNTVSNLSEVRQKAQDKEAEGKRKYAKELLRDWLLRPHCIQILGIPREAYLTFPWGITNYHLSRWEYTEDGLEDEHWLQGVEQAAYVMQCSKRRWISLWEIMALPTYQVLNLGRQRVTALDHVPRVYGRRLDRCHQIKRWPPHHPWKGNFPIIRGVLDISM